MKWLMNSVYARCIQAPREGSWAPQQPWLEVSAGGVIPAEILRGSTASPELLVVSQVQL